MRPSPRAWSRTAWTPAVATITTITTITTIAAGCGPDAGTDGGPCEPTYESLGAHEAAPGWTW